MTERALSFGAIAADYDRLRPSRPIAAVRWLLPVGQDGVGAAGTLPGSARRRRPRRIAPAESTSGRRAAHLTGVALDGPKRTLPEIARVLRDGGRFGVIWTSRDRSVGWVATFTRRMTADDLVAMLGTYGGLITEIDVPMISACWRTNRTRAGGRASP
jgi:hypothetical protein